MVATAALAVVLGACGDDGLGTGRDGGVRADAGTTPDGGAADSGMPGSDGGRDSGAAVDGATPADAGAGGDAGEDPTDRSRCTAMPDVTGTTTRTVTLDGDSMQYVAYVPTSYDPAEPQDVLLALHGAGDVASNYLAVVWRANADARGFLVVAPEGSCAAGSGNTWCMNDPNLALAALEDLEACYTTNPHRRIMHGFSAGGILAYLIGLQVAEAFAGISIAAANLGSAQAISSVPLLPADWLIPVSHFHGTSDTNFPIDSARAGRDQLEAAGHTVYWHEFDGGHTTNATHALTMWDDLASSMAP